ncbi:MAG: sulfatase/phosphatase domain-containing protein, partial [Phycisphaerae bacterium]
FRMHKHWVHEGGISTPLIVSWPGKTDAGKLTGRLTHVSDIMPTCLELAGVEYPTEFNGKPITPVAGESFAGHVVGNADTTAERVLFWEHEGNCAVRQGRWKLVQKFETEGQWELYDMLDDRTELNDLAAVKDDVVRRMDDMYTEWTNRMNIIPRRQLLAEQRQGRG